MTVRAHNVAWRRLWNSPNINVLVGNPRSYSCQRFVEVRHPKSPRPFNFKMQKFIFKLQCWFPHGEKRFWKPKSSHRETRFEPRREKICLLNHPVPKTGVSRTKPLQLSTLPAESSCEFYSRQPNRNGGHRRSPFHAPTNCGGRECSSPSLYTKR